jgi:rhamnosyltransferase
MEDKRNCIVAIIVSYQPDLGALSVLLTTLAMQVAQIVVVDNGSDTDVAGWLVARRDVRVHSLRFGENRGVATAQNAGIAWARERGARYIALFDQDSEPALDMVERLVGAAETMEAQGYLVATVGPRHLDVQLGNPMLFIRVRGLRVERYSCTDPDEIIPVDYLMSSGCLIPMATLDIVGGMTEDLFIDYVDIEWCMRAKHRGYQSFGACGAIMQHRIGDAPLSFCGRKFPLHSPLRHYYLFRNAVWMYRQKWPPLHWKLTDGYRLFLKYGFYMLFTKSRLEHLRMMTLGIWHGLRGRNGSIDAARG